MLFSGSDNAIDFFGTKHLPCNLYKNPSELEHITKKLNGLQRFNVWCDALLERHGNYFVIKNTKLLDDWVINSHFTFNLNILFNN